MKLKYKILIHFVFWLYILNQAAFPYYLNEKVPYLIPDLTIHMVTAMLSFYVYYFTFNYLFGLKNKLLSVLIGLAFGGLILVARLGIEYPWRSAHRRTKQHCRRWKLNGLQCRRVSEFLLWLNF